MDYKLTGSKLIDHTVGTILIDCWEHREINSTTTTTEIVIYKSDPDKPDTYGTKLFKGSLEELISRLEVK